MFGTNASGDKATRTTSLPSSTAFTACGWAYTTSERSAWQIIAGIEDATSNSTLGMFIGYKNDNVFSIFDDGGVVTNFASRPSVGTYFFWALTCSGTAGGTFNGYWANIGDSAFVKANQAGSSFTPAMLIFGNDSFDEWYDGRSGVLKVFSAALSEAELLNEMYTILPKRLNVLNSWHPTFNDTNDNLLDYSGNGRSLTAAGTLTLEDNPPISWGAPSDDTMVYATVAATRVPRLQYGPLNRRSPHAAKLRRMRI